MFVYLSQERIYSLGLHINMQILKCHKWNSNTWTSNLKTVTNFGVELGIN
mgnify:CR=1 FL=1